MEGATGPQYNPRTVEAVFRDYKGRRAGLIKALTTGMFLSVNFRFCFHFFILFFFNIFFWCRC